MITMKPLKFWLVVPLIAALVVSLVVVRLTCTVAASAKPARVVRVKGAPAPRWEYGFVVSGTLEGRIQGVTAFLPQGQTLFQGSGSNGFKAIAALLNKLGSQGWEVAGYHDAGNQGGEGRFTWTLRRRK